MGYALETPCLFCGRKNTEVQLVEPEDSTGGVCLDCARMAVAVLTNWAPVEPEGERDETPTVCAAQDCGRTRPRWTMENVGGAWVCAPQFMMSCGGCCEPGQYLTHYTEEEHDHQADTVVCVRCGRERDRSDLKTLSERAGGGLACGPHVPENYDECQRIYNTV
jgi:hypothetical protein